MSASLYVRPSNVAILEGEDGTDGASERLYVAHLPHGPLVVLDGSAAVVWDVATADGPVPKPQSDASAEDAVTARVALALGVSFGDIREDVCGLLVDLVRRGLLMPAGTARGHR